MPRLQFSVLLVCVVALAGPGVAFADSPDLGALVTNSPFGKPPAAAAAAATPSTGPLEFRGVFIDNGESFFSLYDAGSRRALWVGLNEPDNPFVVRSYDEAKGMVTVDYQGQQHTIALKQSKVLALASPPVAAPTAPAVGTPPQAVQTPPDEAARLAQIAEEIRRRRAIRAQAAGAGLPPQPQAGPGRPPASAAPPSNRPRTP